MIKKNNTNSMNNRVERVIWLLVLLFSFSLYSITNQLEFLRLNEIKILKWPLDDHMPLLPVFIIPYLYWYLQVVFSGVMIMLTRWGRIYYRMYAITMILAMVSANIIFVIFPTHVPRPTLAGDGILYLMLGFIYRIDQPYNCFPSLHAAIATINAIFCHLIIRENRASISNATLRFVQFINIIGWILICLATIFTGQHYLPDLAGGIFIAMMFSGLTFIIFRRKNLPEI